MNTVCPYCGKVNELASEVTPRGVLPPRRPPAGSLSICIGCAGVGVFTEDGARKPTDEERAQFAADPELSRLVARVVAGIGEIRRAEWN